AISVMVWPVLPESADKLRDQLGLAPVAPAPGHDQWPFARPARAGTTKTGVAAPLFPRIEPDQEEELLTRLGLAPAADAREATSGTAGAPPVAPAAASGAALASYDDFAKLDLRIGTVVRAERVSGKDKLLSLAVDIGEPEPRPIVAGLAQSFRPED